MRPGRIIFVILSVLLSVFIGLTYFDYQRDLRKARNRVSADSLMAQTPCGPTEYVASGEGPPILIIHGAGGGFDQVLDFARPFTNHGFQFVAVSRFGYLRTPLPADASPEAQADAYACLLDALGIGRLAGIIGVSAGAPSAMQFVLRHPARSARLVLVVPLAFAPRPEGATSPAPAATRFLFDTALRYDFLYWLAKKTMTRTLATGILATPPEDLNHADADERARARSMLDHILPVSLRRPGLLNDAKVAETITRYDLERIAIPTLAISVSDDLYGTYEAARYTAEQIPGARFVGYPSGGHVWIGHNDEVMSEITTFLKARR